MYFLKIALGPWRNAFFGELLVSLWISLLLILVGTFWLIDSKLRPFILTLKNDQVLTVFINPELSKIDQARTLDKIKTLLNIDSLVLTHQSEFLEKIKKQSPELVAELENLGEDLKGLVPIYVSAAGSFKDEQIQAVNQITGVEKIDSTKEKHHDAVAAFNALKWMVRLLLMAAGGALMLVFWQMNRSHADTMRSSWRTLTLWGASKIQAHLPLILGGLVSGLVAGFLAALGWEIGSTYVLNRLTTLSPVLAKLGGVSGFVAFLFPTVAGAIGAGLGFIKNEN